MADVVNVLSDKCARVTRESFADDHVEFVPQHVVRRLDLEFVSPEPPVVGEDDGVVVALLEDSSGDVIVELRVRDDGERDVCPLPNPFEPSIVRVGRNHTAVSLSTPESAP